MINKELSQIASVKEEVRKRTSGEATGHDWWHLFRVWRLSRRIMEGSDADALVVELGALTHDLADHKLTVQEKGLQLIRQILQQNDVHENTIVQVLEIAKSISFKGADVDEPELSQEARIVQDADRLDAIGAIGIARTFAYGGSKGRSLYDPDIQPENHQSFTAYKNSTAPTINHFYEKLLLLKDRLNTPQAKIIAEERHQYMEEFLNRFYREWEGEG